MTKQPRRPQHVAEWAARAGLRQADVADHLGADKSVVSRWFSGSTPGEEWQARLAELFGCKPGDLFRSPDDAWFSNFAAALSPEEIERAKAILQAAFPTAASAAEKPRAGRHDGGAADHP